MRALHETNKTKKYKVQKNKNFLWNAKKTDFDGIGSNKQTNVHTMQ